MTGISTPCRNICVLDREVGLCEGCGRTLDEIARWGSMDEDERRAIMATLDSRPGPQVRSGSGDRLVSR